VPQTQAKPSLGGLGALAGLAGVDLGGGGNIDATTSLQTILNDYSFEQYMIKKYNLIEKFNVKKENLVFALNYDKIYNYLHNDKEEEQKTLDEQIFDIYKTILDTISISSDKKSGIIKLSATLEDRFLAKELVDIYLRELTSKLRELEMRDVQKQIDYYKKELDSSMDLSIKEQLSSLISGLVQKKVLSLANEYYNVRVLTNSQIAYIKDKTKPKRGLIVIVSFVTSIILAIFMVFFLEFISNSKEEK